jgi:riboflavin biosynthesis pyrimidine reductase
MRVVVACALVAGLLALAPVSVAQTPPPPAKPGSVPRGPTTREALDQYLKGDYEAAVGNPPKLARFNFEDAERWMSSGGAAAAEAFLSAGMVDRLLLYRAPVEFSDGIPAFREPGPTGVPEGWRLADRRRLGSDTLEVYHPG